MIKIHDPIGKQQAYELKTIKPRKIVLNLSDADMERLQAFSDAVSLSPCELIERFIGDLTGGTKSNGSNERLQALAWYEGAILPVKKEDRTEAEQHISEELLRVWNRTMREFEQGAEQ